MIQISETAARKIRTLMAKQGIDEGGLRVGVKGGGCSGLSYTFAWERQAAARRRGVRRARRREDFRRQEEPAVSERHGPRLRHEPDQQGVRVQQPEREDDLRLRQLVRRVEGRVKQLSSDPSQLDFHLCLPDIHPTLQICRSCGGGAPVDVHFCPQCTKILTLGRHGDYFAFLGLPRKLNLDLADLEQAIPRAQPAVSSGLLLQRDAGRAPRQPRAVVVSERRVSDAEAADRADRVSAGARRPGRDGPDQGVQGKCRPRCSRRSSR